MLKCCIEKKDRQKGLYIHGRENRDRREGESVNRESKGNRRENDPPKLSLATQNLINSKRIIFDAGHLCEYLYHTGRALPISKNY